MTSAMHLKLRLIKLLIFLCLVFCIRPGTHVLPRFHSSQIHQLLLQEAPGWDGPLREEVHQVVLEVSRQYDIDPALILAVIKVESTFRPSVRSSKGAIGLMQVTPIAAREVLLNRNDFRLTGTPTFEDPEENIRMGTHYLHLLLTRFHGNLWQSLTAYNEGPTQVARKYSHTLVPGTGYAAKVLKTYLKFKGNYLS